MNDLWLDDFSETPETIDYKERVNRLITENIRTKSPKLDLGNCNLSFIPEEVCQLTWLLQLSLSNSWQVWNGEYLESHTSKNFGFRNAIRHIPDSIKNLKYLKHLFLGSPPSSGDKYDVQNDKKVLFLKKDFYKLSALKNLEQLEIYNGVVSEFETLINFKKLKYLDVYNVVQDTHYYSKEHIDIRPIFNLKSLECLDFRLALTPEIEKILHIYKLINLKQLHLKSNIEDLLIISKLKNLRYLEIQGSLKDIYHISNLTKIECLLLNNCNVSDLSPLKKLKKLKKLNVRSELINNIEPLSSLDKLSYLNISNSKIENISYISKCLNLKKLILYSCEMLTSLMGLEKLMNIEFLDIRKTAVVDLSPIENLIKMGIPIEYNEYKDKIIISFGILIDENKSFVSPPNAIIKNGKIKILEYFEDLRQAKLKDKGAGRFVFKNTEIKLILIGNSTAGKTSLSQYLRERIFNLSQTTTEGIIGDTKWQPKDRDLQVNLWDFGGQEYYHATHRMFLSHNAVYALVWDAQTDQGGFCETTVHFDNDLKPITLSLEHFPKKWWLQNIRHYTRESNPPVPVLMVQNKCARDGLGEVSSDFGKPPFNLSPEARNNHIDLEATANEQISGELEGEWTIEFKRFEKRLVKVLETQMAHYEFAVYHRDIRDRVRSLAAEGVNDISWADFEKLARDIEADAKMDLVQIYLRDITGDILYYPNNKRLKERVFLRPAWVCNCIYAILSRKVLEREGLFDLAWVCEALGCEEREALDFVELMRLFDLVFQDKDDSGQPNGQYVAPQYLPEQCSTSEYLRGLKGDQILTHAFTLWFPEFLPKSHVARFISNWGERAEGRIFWKNGLLFKTENLKVLVERTEDFKVLVEIQTGDELKRVAAMRRVLRSFLDLEEDQGYWETPDGKPWELPNGEGLWKIGDGVKFAVSMNGINYALWDDIYEAIHTQAKQVKTYPPETAIRIDLQPFTIFQRPIMATKKVFISYSHKDEDAMKELDKFLGPLERKGDISIWTDRKILPGQNWKSAILSNLEDADLTLLLVSANFLDSDFINNEEIPRAFQRMNNHGKPVIPIILNHCLWDITDLSALLATPKDGRPIADYQNPAQAWSEVARGIMGLLKTL